MKKMELRLQYFECVECKKQIIKDKEFLMNCPICNNIMKIKKLEINGRDNEQNYYRKLPA